jgi:hypothetical protein
MLVRQKTVVQLGITEVQWNQCLLAFNRFYQSPNLQNSRIGSLKWTSSGTATKAGPEDSSY